MTFIFDLFCDIILTSFDILFDVILMLNSQIHTSNAHWETNLSKTIVTPIFDFTRILEVAVSGLFIIFCTLVYSFVRS